MTYIKIWRTNWVLGCMLDMICDINVRWWWWRRQQWACCHCRHCCCCCCCCWRWRWLLCLEYVCRSHSGSWCVFTNCTHGTKFAASVVIFVNLVLTRNAEWNSRNCSVIWHVFVPKLFTKGDFGTKYIFCLAHPVSRPILTSLADSFSFVCHREGPSDAASGRWRFQSTTTWLPHTTTTTMGTVASVTARRKRYKWFICW